MAQTKAGGLKVSATIRAKYGDDYWKKLGAIGGKNGNTGGFHNNPERARLAGAKGGRKGRRGAYISDEQFVEAYVTSKSVTEVAEKTGYRKDTIYNRVVALRKRGIDLPPIKNRARQKTVTKIQIEDRTSTDVVQVAILPARKRSFMRRLLGKAA